MLRRDHQMTQGSGRTRAALARDAALARVRRTRRWVIAGSAALIAGFAALVSAAAPGRTLGSTSQARTGASTAASRSPASSSAIPKLPALANPSDLGLQGPDQAPQSVPSQPQAPQTPSSSSGGGGGAGASGSSGGGGPVVSGGS
jgi:hypothetical protein